MSITNSLEIIFGYVIVTLVSPVIYKLFVITIRPRTGVESLERESGQLLMFVYVNIELRGGW